MTDLADGPIRIRRDSVYLKTDEGILFKNFHGTFHVKGSSIYSTFEKLVPYLDGRFSLNMIIDSVKNDAKKATRDFLNLLLERSITMVIDSEDASLIPENIWHCFAPQLEFVTHYADKPNFRFLKFRNSQILLTGSGAALQSAGASLIRNGLRELHLAAETDGGELIDRACADALTQDIECKVISYPTLPDPSGFELVIYCSEHPALDVVHHLNAGAKSGGYDFIPSLIYQEQAYTGPIVAQDIPGCWTCAMLRWSDNVGGERSSTLWQAIALGRRAFGASYLTSDVTAQILGNTVAMEAFKHSVGQPGPDGIRRLLHHDLATLEAKLHDILPHPECPCCVLHEHPETQRVLFDTTRPDNDLLDPNLKVWKPYMGHEFAAFPNFDDESIEQIPLRISALRFRAVSANSADRTIYGLSLKTSDDARLRTLMNATRSRVATSETIRLEKREGMNEAPSDVIQPEQIVGWLGNSPIGPWTGATSAAEQLGDGSMVYVPAGAVHFTFDREHYFDRHDTGIGVGLSIDAATEDALRSALDLCTVMGLSDGTLTLQRWRLTPANGDATTKFLLSSLSTLGLESIDIGIVSPRPGAYSAIFLPTGITSVPVSDLLVVSDFSAAGAVNALLTEKCAELQIRRIGRDWTAPRRLSGIYENANIPLAQKGEFDSPAAESPNLMQQFLDGLKSEGQQAVRIVITPPDIASTQTLSVVKVLLYRNILSLQNPSA